jgi:hypothetical protein
MAIFRLSMEPVSRAKGRSATASAAYRSGTKIHDQRTGMTWDFTRRTGVEHAEIVLPESASDTGHWARDRSALWNAAELVEKRKDARTAREYGLALPHEFTRDQQVELVRRFSVELARRYEVAVDFAIHLPHWHGDQRNVHAHLLATTRQVRATGLGEKVAMEWSDTNLAKAGLGSTKKQLVSLRAFWTDIQNAKFKELGMNIRVDHRTLEAQGIDRQPTSHLGPAVSAMHRQGMQTRVGQRIAQEQRQAAVQRAERLKEMLRLERERAQVDRSILDVSADLAAAQRDLVEHRPSLNLEDIRKRAREEWLALREARSAKASEAAAETAKETPAVTPEAPRTVEEIQRQARENWLEYRRQQLLNPGQVREESPDREQGRAKDRGYGIDDDTGL